MNLKTGLDFGYKTVSDTIPYLSQHHRRFQFYQSDVSGIVGAIPAYDILDISSLQIRFLK